MRQGMKNPYEDNDLISKYDDGYIAYKNIFIFLMEYESEKFP